MPTTPITRKAHCTDVIPAIHPTIKQDGTKNARPYSCKLVTRALYWSGTNVCINVPFVVLNMHWLKDNAPSMVNASTKVPENPTNITKIELIITVVRTIYPFLNGNPMDDNIKAQNKPPAPVIANK